MENQSHGSVVNINMDTVEGTIALRKAIASVSPQLLSLMVFGLGLWANQ